MDLLRHRYLYSHHHPYRLAGMRYGAVSPYQVVSIPRCTCECYCERSRVQFAEGESRNAPDTDREGRARDFDDLKNGKLFMPRENSIVGALRVKYSRSTSFLSAFWTFHTSSLSKIQIFTRLTSWFLYVLAFLPSNIIFFNFLIIL